MFRYSVLHTFFFVSFITAYYLIRLTSELVACQRASRQTNLSVNWNETSRFSICNLINPVKVARSPLRLTFKFSKFHFWIDVSRSIVSRYSALPCLLPSFEEPT